MNEKIVDNRESGRVFFTLEEGINATITSHKDKALSIPITLLSLSAGGLSFMGNRYKLPKIAEGDRVTLTAVTTPLPLGPIDQLEADIVYVLDFQHNVRLSFGCRFTGLPLSQTKKIHQFVHFRLDNLQLTE